MTQDRKTRPGATDPHNGLAGVDLRPLTARSVVASLLLGTESMRLPVGLLVEAASAFGITEGTTRTALSRMAERGEVDAADGAYTLTGRLAARAGRQQASLHPPRGRWNEQWFMVVVTAERRAAADRAGFRAAMTAAHFGELRDGVWLRPDNLPRPELPAGCDSFVAQPVPAGTAAALAARLWDLAGWAQTAAALVRALDQPVRDLRAGTLETLPDGFILAAAALRHLLGDPLLPPALLADGGRGWPGDDLRDAYRAYQEAMAAVMQRWVEAARAGDRGGIAPNRAEIPRKPQA